MTKTRWARLATAGVMAVAVGAALPATAGALQVTVTGDDGNPLTLGAGVAIRNMSPTVGIGLAAGEEVRYAATFAGPDGVAAAGSISCLGTGTSRSLDYRGNGAYTVRIQPYSPSDFSCRTPAGAPAVYSFTINAGVALTRLSRRRLIRAANSFSLL